MDERIIAAVITGGLGLVGVFLSWLFSNLKLPSLSKQKRRNLDGSWRGKTEQDSGPQGTPITVDLVLEIKTSWKKITGTCRVQGGGNELNLALQGGYRDLDHVYFEYWSIDKNKINFGFVLLRLNGNGDELVGKTIGYGNASQSLIKGDTSINKIS